MIIKNNINYRLFLVSVLIIITSATGFYFLSLFNPHKGKLTDLSAYAAQILETCSQNEYRPTCYENEVPKLLNQLTMEETFEVVRLIRAQDTSYAFCHVLAHKLGERETAKDIKKWTQVIPRCPSDGLCSNGCLHGAIVERFSNEVLDDKKIEAAISDLKIACEARDGWSPTNLDQAICYHGLGHLAVHMTGARTDKSLEICEQIALKPGGRDYQRVCIEGIYMQYFQPLEPEDFALIDRLKLKPTKDDLKTFCKTYSLGNINAMEACWREGWALYRNTESLDADIITQFCSRRSSARHEDNCYNSVFYGTARLALNDPKIMLNICDKVLPQRQSQCFGDAAAAFIEEDKGLIKDAVAFCSSAKLTEIKNRCYEYLTQVAGFIFHSNSETYISLCNSLPVPWNKKCML